MEATTTNAPTVIVPDGGRPIKSWAVNPEEGALDQARNLARLPFVHRHIALMPDAHKGYGMPIGGVLAAKKAVVPYAIGVDIGCGVVLNRTGLSRGDFTPERLEKVLRGILDRVPVGNGPQAQHQMPQEWHVYLGPAPSPLVNEIMTTSASYQLGSLGGGNHFIELQADADGEVFVMLHSGSRSLGKKICDYYAKLALEENRRWYSQLPDKELAFLPHGTPGHVGYWQSMEFALRFAELNREHMLQQVHDALGEEFGPSVDFDVIADCHHNYAAWESHLGENVIVHRKGAVRAREGDDVLIPGSMGANSYWCTGKGNADAFMTSPHGAGRQLGRKAAERQYKIADLEEQLAAVGTTLMTPDRNAVIDELPAAYKPIDQVMAASESLVEIKKELSPFGTVKG